MQFLFRYKFIILILAISTNFYFVESLSAKCPEELYIIKGKVGLQECCDCEELIPIENATILVFLDDHERGETGFSVENGDFEIPYIFNTYKGMSLLGDRCGKKPSKLTIIVQAEGYHPAINKIKIKEPVIKDTIKIFEIPPIIMTLISQAEINWKNGFINNSNASKLDETDVGSHASKVAYPDASDMTLTLTDKNNSIKFEVAQDGCHLIATNINGKELWRVDVIKAIDDHLIVGTPVIRNISLSNENKGKIHAVVGKHTFVDIDFATGNVKWMGSD